MEIGHIRTQLASKDWYLYISVFRKNVLVRSVALLVKRCVLFWKEWFLLNNYRKLYTNFNVTISEEIRLEVTVNGEKRSTFKGGFNFLKKYCVISSFLDHLAACKVSKKRSFEKFFETCNLTDSRPSRDKCSDIQGEALRNVNWKDIKFLKCGEDWKSERERADL